MTRTITTRQDEANFTDLISTDTAYVVRDFDGFAILLDAETREPIGCRIYGALPSPTGEDVEAKPFGHYFWSSNGDGTESPDFVRGSIPGWKRVVRGVTPLFDANTISALVAEQHELRRDKDNLQAALTARAKTLLRLRDALSSVHDHLEDEGDRVYFGSTNHADELKDVWQELDGWHWHAIMADGKLPDVYAASRKAHVRATAAQANLAALTEAAQKLVDGITYDVCGTHGQGGNGGLVSTETVKAADETRLALARAKACAPAQPEDPS